MKHLTHTGFYAGYTFCGLNRSSIAAEGDTGVHLPYLTGDKLTAFVETHIDCPKCRQVYQEEYIEDDNA